MHIVKSVQELHREAFVCHVARIFQLLSFPFRAFYLPREFGQLFITVICFNPRANAQAAADVTYAQFFG